MNEKNADAECAASCSRPPASPLLSFVSVMKFRCDSKACASRCSGHAGHRKFKVENFIEIKKVGKSAAKAASAGFGKMRAFPSRQAVSVHQVHRSDQSDQPRKERYHLVFP
jgi:hypothetical protein